MQTQVPGGGGRQNSLPMDPVLLEEIHQVREDAAREMHAFSEI